MQKNQSSSGVTPFNFENNSVRSVSIDGDAWFVGKDVCKALDLSNHNRSLGRLDKDERGGYTLRTPSGTQTVVIINESGLYHLIFRSNKPAAMRFRKWVTSEVLPQIRKTGKYATPHASPSGYGQTALWDMSDTDKLRLQREYVDVVLQQKPNTRCTRFLRRLKPYLFTN